MKKFTKEDILSLGPPFNPSKYFQDNFEGTVIDILQNDRIPFQDRVWMVFHSNVISEKDMRLFAVWSYRQTLQWVKNPDIRSILAADTAENFALGVYGQRLPFARAKAWGVVWRAANMKVSIKSAATRSAEAAAWTTAESAKEAAIMSSKYSKISAARAKRQKQMVAAQKDKIIEIIQKGETK